MVSATSRSSCAGPIFPATAATWESTHPAASRVRAGAAWMVASATVRARQAGTRAGVDLGPEAWEAVAELEGVADELLRRQRRDPEDGAELGDAELRDQRAAGAGDGFLVLTPEEPAADGERRGAVDGLGWVEVGPAGRRG